MLVSSLMDHSEQYMSTYQHWNSISLLKSDTESESENEAVKDITDYLIMKANYYKEHHSNIKAFLKLYLAENTLRKIISCWRVLLPVKGYRTMNLKFLKLRQIIIPSYLQELKLIKAILTELIKLAWRFKLKINLLAQMN